MGASVTTTRGSKIVGPFTIGSTGRLILLEPASKGLEENISATGTLNGLTASGTASLYSTSLTTTCRFDGKPERLNALRNLLDLVGLPSSGKPIIDGFLQLFFGSTQFVPARYTTDLEGVTFSGPTISNLYELYLSASDNRTAKQVNSSDLFSRNAPLLDPVTGAGEAPIQAFFKRMNCRVVGPIA